MSLVAPPILSPPSPSSLSNSIEACYTFVLICLPLSSILVPILLLIFFFSTRRSRRTLLFALNVIIVLLGIAEGVLSTIVQSIVILHPKYVVSDNLFLAYIGIALYTPIIVDCILILRLRAAYPTSITPASQRLTILAVPLLCTVVRVVCVTLVVRSWALLGYQSSALLASQVLWPDNPLIIADWSIQLFENFYCSTLFLCRLRDGRVLSSRMYRQQSIAARLRAVFYIAVCNFVFPSILSIFQLVYVIHDRSVVHGALVLMVNNYISIIGVVFCTIWCASDVWKDTHKNSLPYAFGPQFGGGDLRQSAITLSGIAPNLGIHIRGRGSVPSFTLANHSKTPLDHFSIPKPYETDIKAMKAADSGVNLASTSNGNTSNSYLHTQTLTLNRPPKDADVDNSADSHSPITPNDVRIIIDNESEKDGSLWQAGLARPDPCHALMDGGSRLDPDANSFFSVSDGTDFDFVVPTPPPSSHYRRRYNRHSLSYSSSASSDYRDQRPTSIGQLHVSPTFAAAAASSSSSDRSFTVHNVHRVQLSTESLRRLYPPAEYLRRSNSSLENVRRQRPFVDDDRPSQSLSRARRPSEAGRPDAELGGHFPSRIGRSRSVSSHRPSR